MIKPERLKKGDKVAIVSLSSGMLGESWAIHKYYLAKERLEKDFGFEVVAMPNALKGIDFLYHHPEARAQDLMDAFKDKSIKAIFNAIGGNDTIRILPYIDFDVIKNNPKIFTGFSDTTINHFMMNKAGLVSFYGCSIMNQFSEYIKIPDYTMEAIENLLINPCKNYQIKSSPVYSLDEDKVMWGEANMQTPRKMRKETRGYEILQGSGKVQGYLLGGCADTFPNFIGTSIWPNVHEWKDKILCLECCENDMSPEDLTRLLRNLNAQGILNVINGILVGKSATEKYYEEYKEVYKKVVANEANRPGLPIFYNLNFGHTIPTGLLPFGIKCELDCDNKTITLLENAVK